MNRCRHLRGFQFSLAGLLIGVTFFAIGLAALRFASETWAAIVFTLTMVALCGSLIGCMFCGRETRRCWIVFSLAGWTYLLITFGPWFNLNVRPRLLTTQFAQYLQPRVQELVQLMQDSDHERKMEAYFVAHTGWKATGPPWSRFEQTMHCIVAWLLAIAAGVICRRRQARRTRPTLSDAPNSQGVVGASGDDRVAVG